MKSIWKLLGSLSVVAASSSAVFAQNQKPAGITASQPAPNTVDIVDTAIAAGSFKTLAAALQAAGLVDTLKGPGPFTVFAPTDEAFAKLPKSTLDNLLKPENKSKLAAILTYHVVPGTVKATDVVNLKFANTINGQRVDIAVDQDAVTLDGSTKVTKTDIIATNGVIHVIDSVILPVDKSIVDVARGAGTFNTLAAALKAAGLIEALASPGPFTVFAPTDEAFAKLPDGTLDNLLKPENKDRLIAVLKYHVIPGRAYASDVVSLRESPRTLQGAPLPIDAKGGSVTIRNKAAAARVTSADIEANNGVIHVIDQVLIPE